MTERVRRPHKAKQKRRWEFPDWMRPYEDMFVNTGGNSIEDLMNRDPREANVVINAPVALICCAVESQVALLTRLRNAGMLPPTKPRDLGPQPR